MRIGNLSNFLLLTGQGTGENSCVPSQESNLTIEASATSNPSKYERNESVVGKKPGFL
jgi:hypothetical protein